MVVGKHVIFFKSIIVGYLLVDDRSLTCKAKKNQNNGQDKYRLRYRVGEMSSMSWALHVYLVICFIGGRSLTCKAKERHHNGQDEPRLRSGGAKCVHQIHEHARGAIRHAPKHKLTHEGGEEDQIPVLKWDKLVVCFFQTPFLYIQWKQTDLFRYYNLAFFFTSNEGCRNSIGVEIIRSCEICMHCKC